MMEFPNNDQRCFFQWNFSLLNFYSIGKTPMLHTKQTQVNLCVVLSGLRAATMRRHAPHSLLYLEKGTDSSFRRNVVQYLSLEEEGIRIFVWSFLQFNEKYQNQKKSCLPHQECVKPTKKMPRISPPEAMWARLPKKKTIILYLPSCWGSLFLLW